ncbi:exported hypothetical protein [Candidatus Accumulibacter aalborgensis]|uniref:Uncharacterized protein n=1 Tax=Candidatus Accumulibacter aalborgensis TaxID=1860102 RepID=A0A1A8XL61_9PROT|nr:exported hypothetical protein [Candidatus Accumulibacter aalborgensis]
MLLRRAAGYAWALLLARIRACGHPPGRADDHRH